MTEPIGRRVAGAFKIAALAVAMIASPAQAQEFTDGHLAAARAALEATEATTTFDQVLLGLAGQIKEQRISFSPDKLETIDEVVNEEVLKLATRRGDLESEAARIYAKTFSEDELKAIAEFYASDTGKKFLRDAPLVARELSRAAQVWTEGVKRDLTQAVAKRLDGTQ